MSDPMVVFPVKLLKQFIQMYKESPCLWDKDHPSYKIRMKRRDAITRLTKLVQEHDSEATRIHILRKIESLRSCVRREYKRVEESRQIASTPGEVYTPTLWYYKLFSFLFDKEQKEQCNANKKLERPACLAEQSVESEEDELRPERDENIDDSSYEDYEFVISPLSPSADADDGVQKPSTSKRPFVTEDCVKGKKAKSSTEVEDEYDAIGINVAAKLRYLPPNMRIIAEKLINDVLFQAQINGLSSTTLIYTPDPFKTDIHYEK